VAVGAAAALVTLADAVASPAPAPGVHQSFALFVDEYLDRFGHYHPSIAAGNGLHGHDGELEDFSAPSIAAEIGWLRTAHDVAIRHYQPDP
jgi:hypothetical protein